MKCKVYCRVYRDSGAGLKGFGFKFWRLGRAQGSKPKWGFHIVSL